MRERIQLRMNGMKSKLLPALTFSYLEREQLPLGSLKAGYGFFFHIDGHACSMSITVLLKPRKLYQSGMLQAAA